MGSVTSVLSISIFVGTPDYVLDGLYSFIDSRFFTIMCRLVGAHNVIVADAGPWFTQGIMDEKSSAHRHTVVGCSLREVPDGGGDATAEADSGSTALSSVVRSHTSPATASLVDALEKSFAPYTLKLLVGARQRGPTTKSATGFLGKGTYETEGTLIFKINKLTKYELADLLNSFLTGASAFNQLYLCIIWNSREYYETLCFILFLFSNQISWPAEVSEMQSFFRLFQSNRFRTTFSGCQSEF